MKGSYYIFASEEENLMINILSMETHNFHRAQVQHWSMLVFLNELWYSRSSFSLSMGQRLGILCFCILRRTRECLIHCWTLLRWSIQIELLMRWLIISYLIFLVFLIFFSLRASDINDGLVVTNNNRA